MKNLSSSHSFKPQGHLFKTDNYRFELEDDSTASALSQGLYHQVEDWIALELTAEQMLSDEMTVVRTYVADDAHSMWEAIKETLLPYELAAGQMLLRAADPTQVEWMKSHWWDESSQH
ncbi:MAG: hypothetical protein ABW044_10840 [Cellvibrio sp.]